ncbi:TPA: DUF551 domain-containing protein [Enterobacter hormaechei]|nr:DUF551 domain-containing protein [Enterobacter hormaechei]
MSTITREFTKEQLQQIIETDHVQCGEASSLARIALASLEAEPVCVIDQSNLDYLKSGSDADVWPASRTEMGDVLLYRSAPPAPVSVPDERYQHLSELYHAQEKRLFKLAQRIKGASFDKYAYSPSQAIDVLESAIFGEREDECRAAMLQGAENVESRCTIQTVPALDSSPKIAESRCSNSPVIPDGWVACSDRLPPEGYEPDGGAVCYLVWHKNEVDCGPQYSISNVFFLRKHWEKNFTHWMPLPAAPQQEA